MFTVLTDRIRAHVFVSNSKFGSTRFSLTDISSRAGRPPGRGSTLFLFYFFISNCYPFMRGGNSGNSSKLVYSFVVIVFSGGEEPNHIVISVLYSGSATRPTITRASGLLAPRSARSFRVHGRLPSAVRVVVVAAIVLHGNRRLSART